MNSPQVSNDSKEDAWPASQECEMTFPESLNYDNFMRPKTPKVFQFKSRRLDFCRRKTHQHKMVMIIQFEGVIGEINRSSLSSDNLQLMLRHGVVEGLKELLKNFQLVLFSFLTEKTVKLAVEYLLKNEGIVFDGVYTKI